MKPIKGNATLQQNAIQAPSKPCCILGEVLDIIIQTKCNSTFCCRSRTAFFYTHTQPRLSASELQSNTTCIDCQGTLNPLCSIPVMLRWTALHCATPATPSQIYIDARTLIKDLHIALRQEATSRYIFQVCSTSAWFTLSMKCISYKKAI